MIDVRLPERDALREAHGQCPECDGLVPWILDCHVLVKCPSGNDESVHLHARCGVCGAERIIPYEEEPDAPFARRPKTKSPPA